MKPGDLIEWYYKIDNKRIESGTKAYSLIMKCVVHIGGVAIFVYHKNNVLCWINNYGCFKINFENIEYDIFNINEYDIGICALH